MRFALEMASEKLKEWNDFDPGKSGTSLADPSWDLFDLGCIIMTEG